MKKTGQDLLAFHRQRVSNVRNAAKDIMPWLQLWTERGRCLARTSLTELDVTAQFAEHEDKVISLFASLASTPRNESFVSSSVWNYGSPSIMVRRRLFTEVGASRDFSVARFKRLMDIMWQWNLDYGSVTNAFESLQHDPDPASTLKWMMGDENIIVNPDFRIPRFLMALMTYDDGIGQGLIPYHYPENLSVPLCSEVKASRKDFIPVRDVEFGETSDILGLQYETDLYYLALGWNEVKQRNSSCATCAIRNFARHVQRGTSISRWHTLQYFRLIDDIQ